MDNLLDLIICWVIFILKFCYINPALEFWGFGIRGFKCGIFVARITWILIHKNVESVSLN